MKDHEITSTAEHLFDMMGDQALTYALRQQAAFDRSLPKKAIQNNNVNDDADSSDDWSKIYRAIELISQNSSTVYRQTALPHRLPDGRLSAAASQQALQQKKQAKHPFSAMDALRAVSLKGFWTRH